MKTISHHKKTFKYIFHHLLQDIDNKWHVKQYVRDNPYLIFVCFGSLLLRIYKTYGFMYAIDPNYDVLYNLEVYILNVVIILANIVYFIFVCYMWTWIFYIGKKLKKFYKQMMKEANETNEN